MSRALIVTVIAGVLALPTALAQPVVAGSPLAVTAPTPEATSDFSACTVREGPVLAAGNGCCQRQGGVCGCRNGTPRCCDGTTGAGCSCRADGPVPEGAFTEAL